MMKASNFLNRLELMKNMIMSLLVISGVLYSCGGSKTIEDPKSSKLSGAYKVIAMDQFEIFESHPTLNFDLNQNRIIGSAGCNDYSGNLVLSEINRASFSVTSIINTKMYCSDAIMAVEFNFMKLLGKPLSWQRKGDTLSLFTDQPQASIVAVKTIEQ
jgi:heat shock protein HslJ